MIILNIIGVLILWAVWKMDKAANGGKAGDTVSAFLIPCLMAVSICWVILDIIFMLPW